MKVWSVAVFGQWPECYSEDSLLLAGVTAFTLVMTMWEFLSHAAIKSLLAPRFCPGDAMLCRNTHNM